MKTMKLTGYRSLMNMADLIYSEIVSKGVKITSESQLKELFRKKKMRFNSGFSRAAESLGFINRKPYILWKVDGPMTGDHIKKLLVRIHEHRMKTSTQYHVLYANCAPQFPENIPDCKFRDVYEELMYMQKMKMDDGMNKIEDELKTSMEPQEVKVYDTLKTAPVEIAEPTSIEVLVTSKGLQVNMPLKGVYMQFDGKVSLKFDM
jgi:hypothetical protein